MGSELGIYIDPKKKKSLAKEEEPGSGLKNEKMGSYRMLARRAVETDMPVMVQVYFCYSPQNSNWVSFLFSFCSSNLHVSNEFV